MCRAGIVIFFDDIAKRFADVAIRGAAIVRLVDDVARLVVDVAAFLADMTIGITNVTIRFVNSPSPFDVATIRADIIIRFAVVAARGVIHFFDKNS